MKKLRNVLSNSWKSRRHRRNILNIQITILAWLVEFIGFFLIFLGSFVLRHQNSIVTLSLQTFTFFLYFVLVPSIFLINDSHLKGVIIESKSYIAFLNIFSCFHTDEVEEENREREEIETSVDDIHNSNENENVQTTDDGEDDVTSNSIEDHDSKAVGHTCTTNDSFHHDESECTNKNYFKRNSCTAVLNCETTLRYNDITIIDLEGDLE